MTIDLKEQRLLPALMSLLLVVQTVVTFTVFSFLQPLSYLALGLTILSFLVMMGIFSRHPYLSMFDIAVFLLFLTIISFSFINATDLKSAVYRAIEVWFLLLLFNFYIEKVDVLLRSLAFGFSCCIYGNLALMIFFPDWMFVAEDSFDSFILGGNYNQMGCRFITGIILNIMCIKYGKKWIFNTILISAVSIITLLMVGSMTAISTISLLLLCCLVPSTSLKKMIALGYFIFYLLFHFFVVFNGEGLHNNELAVYIIEDVLGKDITFTNRTGMWDAALRIIEKSPVIGYGMVDREWYLGNMSSFAIGPHNFVLSLFIYGGIVLFIIFWWIFFMAIQKMHGHIDGIGSTLLIGIVTMMFTMSFEVYPFFFVILLLALAYYYPQIQLSYQQRNKLDEEDAAA